MSFKTTLCPSASSGLLLGCEGRALLELDGPFFCQEMRGRDGLLHVEPPIDDADDALRNEPDDARAARRADQSRSRPCSSSKHRRRHARQRALAALDHRFATGPPSTVGT